MFGQRCATLESWGRFKPRIKPVYRGEKAFKLYDTFGLPLDFMVDAARDQGIEFDQAGFDAAMEEQRKRAQASWKGGTKASASPAYYALKPTVFEGYRQTRSDNCEVLAIIKLPGSAATGPSKGSSLTASYQGTTLVVPISRLFWIRRAGFSPRGQSQASARTNCFPVSAAKSCSITRRSMPMPADRLATWAGFIPTTTTLSSPKSKA